MARTVGHVMCGTKKQRTETNVEIYCRDELVVETKTKKNRSKTKQKLKNLASGLFIAHYQLTESALIHSVLRHAEGGKNRALATLT
jgi:hypothetical protein